MNADWLNDVGRAGVFHLAGDSRALAGAAASAGLMVVYADIGHAHDKEDFLVQLSEAMRFPEWFGGNWDALADEFKEAMQVMAGAADYWRAQGKPFWTLIGGPDGWKSGWPDMPSN